MPKCSIMRAHHSMPTRVRVSMAPNTTDPCAILQLDPSSSPIIYTNVLRPPHPPPPPAPPPAIARHAPANKTPPLRPDPPSLRLRRHEPETRGPLHARRPSNVGRRRVAMAGCPRRRRLQILSRLRR